MCVLDFAIRDDFSFVFATGLRSGQKDDEEVLCVGRFPLGLDDLTLWHDELPNDGETLLFSHVPLNKSWRDGQE